MKWFDKWFQKQAKRAWKAAHEENNLIHLKPVGMSSSDRISADGINMKLHVANGGYIVEFHWYDDRKDRNLTELHVINDGEDLGQRLSEVIVQYILSSR